MKIIKTATKINASFIIALTIDPYISYTSKKKVAMNGDGILLL
jgi:hypothetical protein